MVVVVDIDAAALPFAGKLQGPADRQATVTLLASVIGGGALSQTRFHHAPCRKSLIATVSMSGRRLGRRDLVIELVQRRADQQRVMDRGADLDPGFSC